MNRSRSRPLRSPLRPPSPDRRRSVLPALFLFLALPMLAPALAAGGKQEGETGKAGLRPTAEEILARAAERQGGKEIAVHLKNFKASFESRYHDPEKGQIYYEVTRVFQFPDHIWTQKKHELNKKPTLEGFDGEDGWIVTPDGRLTVYTDKPSTYKNDLENLQEDVRITAEMFRYFFIANLRERLQGLTRLSDRPVPRSGKDRPVYVLEGKVTGWIEQEKTVRLLVYVDPESFQVRAVHMDDLSPRPEAPRLFLFDGYHRNDQDVLVPTRVSMYRGDEAKPEMTISMDFAEKKSAEGKREVYPLIRFNVDLDPNLFHVPKGKDEKKGK